VEKLSPGYDFYFACLLHENIYICRMMQFYWTMNLINIRAEGRN
jgi:hypothetical protein